MYVFIWNGQRAEAQRGYNDDLIMAFGIALWVRDTALRLHQQGIDLSRKAIGHLGKSSGMYTGTGNENKSWQMQAGKDKENLNWLLD